MSSPLRFDTDQTLRHARLLLASGAGCIEVRILKADLGRDGLIVANDRYAKTVAGYFDDPEILVEACRAIRGVSAYVTANPPNRALLARSLNRFKILQTTTTDGDIVAWHSWFLDFDAKRPAGISATDEERSLALARRDQFLADHPEIHAAAFWGSSGNGGFVVVRLPGYPNDEDHASLVARAMNLVATRYSDAAVEVDVKTKNPARVMALAGTLKCKGDDTPDRPHRLVTIDGEGVGDLLDLRDWIDRQPVPAPERVARPTSERTPSADWVVDRARKCIAAMRDSVEGNNGHHQLYGVAVALIDGFGLEEATAVELLDEWNQTKAKPPESTAQVRHKVKDAIKNFPSPSCRLRDQEPSTARLTRPSSRSSSRSSLDDPTRSDREARTEEREWKPIRVGSIPEAPPFPVHVLPAVVAEFVATVAESIGCPVDFAGLSVIVTAGATIGRSVGLRLKPGWIIQPALYGLNVGTASSGKSPSLDAVVKPVWDYDAELHQQYVEAMTEFNQKQASKKGKKDDRTGRPKYRSAILDDVTKEVVVSHLELNPRGLLVARDEGSAWIGSFNQYRSGGKGTDREFWLQTLTFSPVKSARKGDEDFVPTRVPHPLLGVIGNITRDKLNILKEDQGRSDGFIERILFAYPDPQPAPLWSDEGIPDEAYILWAELLKTLRSRPMMDDEGKERPFIIKFTPEAKALWVKWYNANVIEANRPGYNELEKSVDGKLVGFTARLALILHLMHMASDPRIKPTYSVYSVPPLSHQAMAGAIELWNYFRVHHRRARWSMYGGVENSRAKGVIDWLKSNRTTEFTVSELTQHLRWLKNQPDDPEATLNCLVERGFIRLRPPVPRPPGQRGQNPSPTYEVNPYLTDSGNSENTRNSDLEVSERLAETYSQNSQNSQKGVGIEIDQPGDLSIDNCDWEEV